jgi:hypothetical protein
MSSMKRYIDKQVDKGNLIKLESGGYEPTLTYLSGDRDESLIEELLNKDYDYTRHGRFEKGES